MPLFSKIATPRELQLPWDSIISEPHSRFCCSSVSFFEWVSCKNIISALFYGNIHMQVKIVLHF